MVVRARMLPALALYALLWWLLVGGESGSWLIGLPFVLAAVWTRERLRRGTGEPLVLSGWLRFVPFFLVQSVLGGIDVARRVLGPELRIEPGFFDYRIRLRSRRARLLFVNTISLLPGTLTAQVDGDRLRVHALDRRSDLARELARLEARVAATAGEVL